MNIFPDSVYVVKPALHLTGEIWLGIKMYKCLARRTGMWPSHMDAFHLNGGGRSREWVGEKQRGSAREGQRARMHKQAIGSEAPEAPWMPTCMQSHFSRVWLCATLWTVAHQAPLSMEFSGQEYWSGLPFPSPGDLRDPGIEPVSLTSPALADGFFTTSATWMSRMKISSYFVSQKPGLDPFPWVPAGTFSA